MLCRVWLPKYSNCLLRYISIPALLLLLERPMTRRRTCRICRRPLSSLGYTRACNVVVERNHVKIIWSRYVNNVIWHFHMIFIFILYNCHMIFTLWVWGPRSGPQTSYCFHIPGDIIFIWFPYFAETSLSPISGTWTLHYLWCTCKHLNIVAYSVVMASVG